MWILGGVDIFDYGLMVCYLLGLVVAFPYFFAEFIAVDIEEGNFCDSD